MITAKHLKVTFYFALFLLLLVASRIIGLDNKPIHFDESINGWFVLQMKTLGYYKYDPENYHGPLYFYLLKTWTDLFGHNLGIVRILPSIFSALSALFFWNRSKITAVLFLLSPGLIFYGRSSIHEMTFVYFQILFVMSLFEYKQNQRLLNLWVMLFGLWGMMTTKETFVFTGFSFVVAVLFVFPWKKFFTDVYQHMIFPIVAFFVAFIFMFTGFLKNNAGIIDFFKAYTFWFKTGVESGHNKSLYYWLEFVSRTEPLLLLAMLATLISLYFKQLRYLAIFALVNFTIYSIIPYKTPWCMISWSWPFYVCFGYLLSNEDININKYIKYLLWFFTGVLLVPNMYSAWHSVYQNKIQLEHEFVYVNSSYSFKAVDDAIQSQLRKRPELRNEVIQIGVEESWPMPWTLQDSLVLRYDRFKNKIYPNALVYFCEISECDLLDKQAQDSYVSKEMSVRQYGRVIKIFLRKDIFATFPEE